MSMPHVEFTLHALLRNSVERDPGKVAVVDGKAEHTYENLERASTSARSSRRLAASFLGRSPL